METVKTEKYLNDLLEKTYDAERGYASAAEATEHVQLKRWLAEQGARRTQFAASLAGEIRNMNSTPETDGSFKGDMHRSWMNIKAALSLNKDEAILEECITGEKAAVEEYDDVLEHRSELPSTVVSILEAQRDEIKGTINEVKTLENIADQKDL
ncbi:ferritin-like domain-containing protein [Nonlabens xiamenensis]|uniref:ferritin-like domain-containing protein n=1 Tax=Nonlabens xiamenensis TaxID=2341043 RepID=UPI000F6061B1|nr:PA2169 family four-helix-bundle protein [Nonlabens xiamenensis]